ncbi:MAG: cytochrome c-type biogenesis protein CcmH [Chloroflexota bacterium]
MKQLALPIAVAALLALGGLVVVQLLRPSPAPTQAEQARLIAAELRCPDCQALSVAESQTASAAAIRRQIAEQLASGQTPGQIRAYFVARYGEWILLAPPSPFAWWIPPLALLAGIGVFAWWLGGRRRAAEPAAEPPAGSVRQQIRDEVEQLDA